MVRADDEALELFAKAVGLAPEDEDLRSEWWGVLSGRACTDQRVEGVLEIPLVEPGNAEQEPYPCAALGVGILLEEGFGPFRSEPVQAVFDGGLDGVCIILIVCGYGRDREER